MSQLKTRILIISDTHGKRPHETDASTDDELSQSQNYFHQKTPTGFRYPLPKADVALHCGDLTYRSTPEEFEATLSMLRAIPAPLKLFIPGNHDLALDPNLQAADEDDDWTTRRFDKAERAEMRALIFDMIHHAEVDGVKILFEGTHTFRLENGARFTIYASPQTPSFGDWAFQYEEHYDFQIPKNVDVAMTHGPPRGVLDFSGMGGVHAGCRHLLDAVAGARPQIHCFGHIHEGWGAYRARWDAESRIDENKSRSVATLEEYRWRRDDDEDVAAEKRRRVREASGKRGIEVDLADGENALVKGQETLFVNAAIMSMMYKPVQMPFIVDINLPKDEQ